jgi:tRNA A37 methylthiotransferase MiaB
VNGRVARERSREIRALIAEKRRAFLNAQIGQSVSALTLDETADGARIALTTNYLKVALLGSELPANRLLNVWVGRVQNALLYGYPEP